MKSFHVLALARMNEYLIGVDQKKGGEKKKVRVESLKELPPAPLVLGRETGRRVNVNPVNHAQPTRDCPHPDLLRNPASLEFQRPGGLLKGQSLFLPPRIQDR
jgi:hypothetical protein